MWYRRAQRNPIGEPGTPIPPFLAEGGILPYEYARDFARALNLKTPAMWQKYVSTNPLPEGIPRNPRGVYEGFSWPDFLGVDVSTPFVPPKGSRGPQTNYMSFEEAQQYLSGLAQQYRVRNKNSYMTWFKEHYKPKLRAQQEKHLPSAPHKIYTDFYEKGGWKAFTGRTGYHMQGRTDLLSFEEAKAAVQKLGLKTKEEYKQMAKAGELPPVFPRSPESFYQDFISWYDFLGTPAPELPPYHNTSREEIQDYIRKNNITRAYMWNQMEHPPHMPPNPVIHLNRQEALRQRKGETITWEKLSGVRAPGVGKSSRGALAVAEALKGHKVDYRTEFRFPELGNFRYDFALLLDGQPVLLIEFHGIQHYYPMRQWGGDEAFERSQKRDQIKRDFAKERGIPLLEISYTDASRINEIVQQFLQTHLPELSNIAVAIMVNRLVRIAKRKFKQ